jgi:uncharacterized protein
MRVTWDPQKAATNLRKHGIRFADAESVMFDAAAITTDDPDARSELRQVTIGSDATGRILVVVFASRRDHIRLISARRATRKERTQYEERIRLH